MEEKAKKKANSSSLKYRFAQMLLGSSCATAATTTTTSTAKLVKLSSPLPQALETPEAHSDCGHDKRLTRHRRKPDRTLTLSVSGAYGSCFTPRVAPMAQVPLGSAAGRHSIHTSEPLASHTLRAETSDEKKARRLTEGAEFYKAFGREEKKLSAASPSSRTPVHLTRRSDRENEAKNKSISEKKCKINKRETMKLFSNAYGLSSSSSFDCRNDLGFCTSDEEEEESPCTLFSSMSFSSDSSEFYQNNCKKKKNSINKEKKSSTNNEKNRSAGMKLTRPSPRPPRGAAKPRSHSWDAGDKFQPLVSYSSSKAEKEVEAAAETKTKAAAGHAVVKRSCDPYMDFRTSMVEMIVGKNIRSAKDLDDLLQSYLSLNAARHHPAIVGAFSDIWNAIFCCLD